MKTMILCCALLLFAVAARAQVALPNEASTELGRNVYGLGLSGGMASGIGLSFRHHLPSIFSYEIIGGIIKIDEDLLYTAGAELQFDLVHNEASRFYACVGSGYYYSGEPASNDLESPFRAGAGIGGEWANFNPFHLNGDLLLTYFSDGTILPLPQVGIHYYF